MALDLRINHRFKLVQSLNSRPDEYLGADLETGENVVIKIEPIRTETPRLEDEAGVYQRHAGTAGIPFVLWYGTIDDFNAMVLELMGPSLGALHRYFGGKLPVSTVLYVGCQMIPLLEQVHKKDDRLGIEPSHFRMGLRQHAGIVSGLGLRTAPISDNTENCRELRRKDTCALFHMLISLLDSTSSPDMANAVPVSSEPFVACLRYVTELDRDEDIDYRHLQRILGGTSAEGFWPDMLDWCHNAVFHASLGMPLNASIVNDEDLEKVEKRHQDCKVLQEQVLTGRVTLGELDERQMFIETHCVYLYTASGLLIGEPSPDLSPHPKLLYDIIESGILSAIDILQLKCPSMCDMYLRIAYKQLLLLALAVPKSAEVLHARLGDLAVLLGESGYHENAADHWAQVALEWRTKNRGENMRAMVTSVKLQARL